jgi:lipoprotein NlpI
MHHLPCAFAVLLFLQPMNYAQERTVTEELAHGWELSERRETAKAIASANRVLELQPENARAFYLRGREYLRQGKFDASVADFDKFIELEPSAAKKLWERGLALYYAGKYEAGAEQFAAYQTYQDNDVENAVWCYMCQARQKSPAFAEENLMKTRTDRRVPMAEVFQMFAGKLEPPKVLAAAEVESDQEDSRIYWRFYANLYVGLYYEAQGNRKLAEKHIRAAADKYEIEHYMWDVAKVHKGLFEKK